MVVVGLQLRLPIALTSVDCSEGSSRQFIHRPAQVPLVQASTRAAQPLQCFE
jgi:hypothetical protein